MQTLMPLNHEASEIIEIYSFLTDHWHLSKAVRLSSGKRNRIVDFRGEAITIGVICGSIFEGT